MQRSPSQPPRASVRPDTLRWTIFLALLGTTQAGAQGGLTPTLGPGGTPIIDNGHGVPVIDIVAPDAGGLSHNQFLDYNVDRHGLVLNNALQAGQSQLAGQLGANSQFQGQAASTILNEVVSQNASRIEGAQEIFGQKADYMLANPNGITVNGGSFINTTRAGFVVGNVDVQGGQVKHLDSRNATGSLNVLGKGLSNVEGALDLIAPRIDTKGMLSAKDDLNLTAGRNRIDANSREVLEHLPGQPGSIDASLFGSMRAGQIRIVSTAEGAGVQVGANTLHAERGDLIIKSAGDLQVQGDELLQANLTATNGKARQIEINAGQKLTLDTATREKVHKDPIDWATKWLFVTTESKKGETVTTSRTQVGSRLQAEDSLDMKAGTQLNLTAAQLEAGNTLQLRSDGQMTLAAGVDTVDVEDHLSHSIYADRTDTVGSSHTEKLRGTTLKAGSVIASAGSDMLISGSQLEAREHIQLDAKGDLNIVSAQEENHSHRTTGVRDFVASAGKTQPDSNLYSAKVGFEHLHKAEKTDSTRQVASAINAGSVSLQSGNKLTISSSNVQANAGDINVNAREIELAAAYDKDHTQTIDTRSGAALSIAGGAERLRAGIDGYHGPAGEFITTDTAKRSTLKANGDLNIDATKLVTTAAELQAGGRLEVTADTIENRAAADRTVKETTLSKWDGGLAASADYKYVTDRAWYAFERIKSLFTGEEVAALDDSAKPNLGAELALAYQSIDEKDTQSKAQVSTFSGGDVMVKAKSIKDEGTDYKAQAGELRIEAREHEMLAARDTHTLEKTQTNGSGSLRVDTQTGTDINAKLAGAGGSLKETTITSVARVGSLQGKNGVHVALEGNGYYEGTRIDGGNGAVSLTSNGDLTLAAAHDTSVTETTQLDAGLALKAGSSLIGANGGLDGNLKHHTRKTETSKAKVGQIDGKGAIELASGGDMRLEGTRIGSRDAATGDITLHSDGQLTVAAAHDTEKSTGNTWGGNLAVSGSALGGGLNGQGTFGWVNESKSTAVGAEFNSNGKLQLTSLANGDQALQVEGLQANARSIGLDARNGGMLIEAAKNTEQRDNLEVTLGAGGSLSAQELAGASALAKVDLEKRNNTTWRDSNLRAGTLELRSNGDTRVEGAQLEAHHIEGEIGGDLLVSSRMDQVDNMAVNVDIRLNQKDAAQAPGEAKPSLKETFEKDGFAGLPGALWSAVTDKFLPSAKGSYARRQHDTVNEQTTLSSTQGIDLQVGGRTKLVGATLKAADGQVELGSGSLSREDLKGRDYQKDVQVNADVTPTGMANTALSFLGNLFQGKDAPADALKPYSSSGHDTTTEYVSKVEQNRKS